MRTKGMLVLGGLFLAVAFLATACATPAPPTPTPTVGAKPAAPAAPTAAAPAAATPAAKPAATAAPVAATPAAKAETKPAAKAPSGPMPRGLVMQGGSAPGNAGDVEVRWWQQQVAKVYPDIAIRHLPGGFNEGAHLLETGEVDVAIIGSDTADLAWNASIDYFKTPHKKLRALYARPSPGSGIEAVVLNRSAIQSVGELKTKRIGTGEKDVTSTFLWEKAIKAVYGFNYDEVRAAGGIVYYGSFEQVSAQVAEGKLDVSLRMQSPTPWRAVDASQPVRWLKFEDKFLQYWVNNYSGYARNVAFLDEFAAYKGKPVAETQNTTVGATVIMAVRDDMPDHVAYNIIKAVMADDKGDSLMNTFRKDWQKVQPPFRLGDNATQTRTIPFHPGAAAYWAEKGTKLPEPMFM
ncbi:MAG: hypothetical protein HY675_05420 [Chloroflexi bacterium]|nr:hypothetical protein [Chloroflexota bacterium]